MKVVVHGSVFSWVEGSPAIDVEVVDHSLSHQLGRDSTYF